jgi:hypothetical protein
MCPLPLETESAPAATCSHVAFPLSNRTNTAAWPRTSTVAFPSLLVKLGTLPERESDSDPLVGGPALSPGSLVHDSPGKLHAAERARIAC